MVKIGLIREGKVPADNRVAFTPEQCKWLQENMEVIIIVQHSLSRCYKDQEYFTRNKRSTGRNANTGKNIFLFLTHKEDAGV